MCLWIKPRCNGTNTCPFCHKILLTVVCKTKELRRHGLTSFFDLEPSMAFPTDESCFLLPIMPVDSLDCLGCPGVSLPLNNEEGMCCTQPLTLAHCDATLVLQRIKEVRAIYQTSGTKLHKEVLNSFTDPLTLAFRDRVMICETIL